MSRNYYRKLLQEIITGNYDRKLLQEISTGNYDRKISASISILWEYWRIQKNGNKCFLVYELILWFTNNVCVCVNINSNSKFYPTLEKSRLEMFGS